MSVLFNASNLLVGGGVQVAASVLDEWALLVDDPGIGEAYPWFPETLEIHASAQVLANADPATRHRLAVHEQTSRVHRRSFDRRRSDVSFTLFGPEYVPLGARHRIVGFADVTSLFPEETPRMPALRGVKQRVRRWLSRWLYGRVDTVIVEAQHVATALNERWHFPGDRIHVVPNTPNRALSEPDRWTAPPEVPHTGLPRVLYVSRNYPHKNIRVLGAVGDLLAARGTPVTFVLTLHEDEWTSLSDATRRHSVNVGAVSVQQLPGLYAAADACIFPSLVEAFSVTPLEALATGRPLVASDRPFVREVAGAVPWYADPRDPASLADALALALSNPSLERIEAGRQLTAAWPTPRDRALSYLEIIDRALPRERRPDAAQEPAGS